MILIPIANLFLYKFTELQFQILIIQNEIIPTQTGRSCTLDLGVKQRTALIWLVDSWNLTVQYLTQTPGLPFSVSLSNSLSSSFSLRAFLHVTIFYNSLKSTAICFCQQFIYVHTDPCIFVSFIMNHICSHTLKI